MGVVAVRDDEGLGCTVTELWNCGPWPAQVGVQRAGRPLEPPEPARASRDMHLVGTCNGTVTAGMGRDLHTSATELEIVSHPEVGHQNGPELSIVVPTLNEVENVPIVVARVAEALSGTRCLEKDARILRFPGRALEAPANRR